VVGFKPPYGRNPEDTPFNLDFYCHSGPLARTVDDCALLQNVMAGPHPRDITTLRPKLRIPARLDDIKGWRIAYSMDLGYFEVDPEVVRNTEAALQTFRDLGAQVEAVDLGWTQATQTAAMNYLGHIFGAFIGPYLATHRYELTDYARHFAEMGAKTTAADFLASLETAGSMYATLGPLLQKYRLLVCPTLALPAVAADQDLMDPDFMINGRKVDAYLQWCMTYPFNMMSRCPVMSVPSGNAASGVPTGIQLVGRTYDDVSVFRAAKAFESARPWMDDPKRRPGL
jgi:Asp-tRNA(Asn)/Glu-tRNA(Gln) amidotransferase A subunit family amidase